MALVDSCAGCGIVESARMAVLPGSVVVCEVYAAESIRHCSITISMLGLLLCLEQRRMVCSISRCRGSLAVVSLVDTASVRVLSSIVIPPVVFFPAGFTVMMRCSSFTGVLVLSSVSWPLSWNECCFAPSSDDGCFRACPSCWAADDSGGSKVM